MKNLFLNIISSKAISTVVDFCVLGNVLILIFKKSDQYAELNLIDCTD